MSFVPLSYHESKMKESKFTLTMGEMTGDIRLSGIPGRYIAITMRRARPPEIPQYDRAYSARAISIPSSKIASLVERIKIRGPLLRDTCYR